MHKSSLQSSECKLPLPEAPGWSTVSVFPPSISWTRCWSTPPAIRWPFSLYNNKSNHPLPLLYIDETLSDCLREKWQVLFQESFRCHVALIISHCLWAIAVFSIGFTVIQYYTDEYCLHLKQRYPGQGKED